MTCNKPSGIGPPWPRSFPDPISMLPPPRIHSRLRLQPVRTGLPETLFLPRRLGLPGCAACPPLPLPGATASSRGRRAPIIHKSRCPWLPRRKELADRDMCVISEHRRRNVQWQASPMNSWLEMLTNTTRHQGQALDTLNTHGGLLSARMPKRRR